MRKIANYHILMLLGALCSLLPAHAEEPNWQPQIQRIYEPNSLGTSWRLISSSNLTYNSLGQVVTETAGQDVRYTYTYDAAGRWISKLTETLDPSSEVWTRTNLKLREYDERTGLQTLNRDIQYLSTGEEQDGNTWSRTITRDDAGNVTEVELAVLFEGVLDPTQRLEIVYGAEGTATEILVHDQLYNGRQFYWQTSNHYTDIRWAATDGQIVSLDNLFGGENRIASAHFENQNNGKPYDDYDIAAQYSADGEEYTVNFRGRYQGIPDAGVERVKSVSTDEAGTTETRFVTTYFTLDSLGNREYPEEYTDLIAVDAQGNELYEQSTYTGPDEAGNEVVDQLQAKTEYALTYDRKCGALTRMIISELTLDVNDVAQMQNVMRVDFLNFLDCSTLDSIKDIVAEKDGDVLYDLAGRPVAHPRRGQVYIKGHRKLKF